MKTNTNTLVKTSMMLALTLVFQIGFRQFAQPLVGPLVNMTLILTAMYVGKAPGAMVGIITPLVAFMLGIIGIIQLVPLIAIGNVLLVVMYAFVADIVNYKWRKYSGVVVAALFKFIFLYVGARALLPLIMAKVPEPIYITFGVSQFVTALIGGIIAVVISGFIPLPIGKYKNVEK